MCNLMKKAAIVMVLVFLLSAGNAVFAAPAKIGEKVSDFKLQDASGGTRSLSSYAGKIVVLAFWSFKCPAALASDDRLAALQTKYGSQGVIILAVDSCPNESGAEIQRNAANLNLSFPVLLDSEGTVAEKLGIALTPSLCILDREGVLRYRGALDNREKVGDKKREAYAESAVESILAGQAVAKVETQVTGCSIRRKP